MSETDNLPQSAEETGELKPFLEHLEDLRWMIIKMLVALSVAMLLCFTFARQLLAIFLHPLGRVTPKPEQFLRTLEVTGGLTVAMKLSFFAGIVLASPFLLYFLAQFVLPALTQREKKMLRPAFLSGTGLFLLGVAMAYFVVLPAGLRFFLEYNEYLGIRSEWTVQSYISFVSWMMLGFGVCFETPMVVLALAKLGIVTPKFLRQKRAYVIVICFVVAAVITPTTDPFNQTLLALPMVLLYEISIWIAVWMQHREKQKS
jgi:sec-independent protein translocase protein TatC